MHNYFYVILACTILLQINANTIISHRMDNVLSLINEEMIASTVTEKSKLEAYTYQDLSFLAIDHDRLMYLVDKTIKSNLHNIEYNVEYYFYDSVTMNNCPIGKYQCNSVQMRILFNYNNKIYEEILRYEPISI